ncbi:Hypothetical predicted protein, partial [Marmota monax]
QELRATLLQGDIYVLCTLRFPLGQTAAHAHTPGETGGGSCCPGAGETPGSTFALRPTKSLWAGFLPGTPGLLFTVSGHLAAPALHVDSCISES